MCVKRKIELLAPGGDVDSIKAAIAAGADAVYCGLDKFNARNRAANLSFEDLQGVLRLAHKNSCKVFLTLNIIIVDREIPALIALLNRLVNTSIDGIIVQDLGLFYLLLNYFKGLKIHASTQLTTHNKGQIKFLSKLNASRINLSRKLNIREIQSLTSVAHQHRILTEVFVHGSYCLSFSGLCYMSSIHGGNSGNRGRCSQPCRDQYLTTALSKNYPLNLKDNSAFFDLKELAEAGVDSLKIEGRIKKYDYVYSIVNTWNKQLQSFYYGNKLSDDNRDLFKVFNRDFSNAFLTGDLSKDMFIDHPRDHSVQHLSVINDYSSDHEQEEEKVKWYNEKEVTKADIERKINQFSIARVPLVITISGESGTPLKVTINTPDTSFVVLSVIELAGSGTDHLNYEMIYKRLKAINDTAYYIEQLELDHLHADVYLPFKELTSIKKKILYLLNDSRETVDPIDIPVLKRSPSLKTKPTLSVLISSAKDLYLGNETPAEIYFQLPEAFKDKCTELKELFLNNSNLIPWFPSVLIGEDYHAAIDFIQGVQPKLIVTNNTGIAFEAYTRGIRWIAGPFMNIVNSFSLICLKENFNCSGAFISNEISKTQLKGIIASDEFELYYSVYHPIVLMTSRQCLFHQVTGCEKVSMDDSCLLQCEKSAFITNLKKETFLIEKAKGDYHHIYHEMNYLNQNVVTDFPNHFSGFMIDLRDINTSTTVGCTKARVIELFEDLLSGNPDSDKELTRIIYPTTNRQYLKGI